MTRRIICTVTNDLNHDQRMQRICNSLQSAGYDVTLVGRLRPHSQPLSERSFRQLRLRCFFEKGFLFYAEYNLRLWFYLMRAACDAVCSVDLDTLPAGCLATLLRRKKRVFDAHEHFTEVPELAGRRLVRAFWRLVERACLPFYQHAYTVGPALAEMLSRRYGTPFSVVRNTPVRGAAPKVFRPDGPKILLYQGALNEGRGISEMLQAMPLLNGVELWLAGEGDLSEPLRAEARKLGLSDKVRFLGMVPPEALLEVTHHAWLGLNLLENKGLSYYYSLANKFFDYVQAGVPGLTMAFPEYVRLNNEFRVAVLLETLSPTAIADAVNHLKQSPDAYSALQGQCRLAARHWHWEVDETALLQVWRDCFRS